ncbi:MAG: hypothetical protein CVT98_00680 [Bacteroidetes bacterium HGW-Bacteroidetes-15]|nr:MAG: hypothetical protein CVT98_00680 [Bacteroidetes bacterium HGW-Bacteroidetes-15]
MNPKNTKNSQLITIYKLAVLLVFFVIGSNLAYSQSRKKTNWLEDKKSHITRWRIGVGANIGEPTGAHVQLYKLSGICTKTVNIKKKFSIDLSISQEGHVFGQIIQKKNSTWEKGGTRGAVDLKVYFPMRPNPYIGVGGEIGSRMIYGNHGFNSDLVAKIGVEQKLFGFRTSTKSLLHASIYAEGKYNYGLTSDFSYFLPTFGLRVHFL